MNADDVEGIVGGLVIMLFLALATFNYGWWVLAVVALAGGVCWVVYWAVRRSRSGD